MRGLEGEMEVYDDLMVRLLADVGLNYRVFELLLKDEVLLLKNLQGIETPV